MNKRFLLLLALLTSSAWAQQNVDISADQFTSGSADGTLTELGRAAAASGKRLIVTAPQHWHGRVAALIRAGGNANIVLKDGFYETLLVRVEDKAAEPPKPEAPAAAPRPEPAPAPKPAPVREPEPVAAPAPTPEPPPPAPAPEPEPEPAPAPAPVATPEPAPAPVAEAAPAPAEPAVAEPAEVDPNAPVMLVVAEPGDVDPVRADLEKRYNQGKRVNERVSVSELQRADVIYAGNGAALVLRRDGSRVVRMWLVGELNLNQIAISKDGNNKYNVLGKTQ